MTEYEYQDGIRDLMARAKVRYGALVDYLVTQPPKRLAMHEARAFTEWALDQGAEHVALMCERRRRRATPQEKG